MSTSEQVDQAPAAKPPLRLYCLGGGEAPAGVGGDLLRMRSLPAEALQRIWQVILPSLAEPVTPEAEKLLDAFCATHALNRDDLARTIRACRFLLREAARLDVPADAFGEDLGRLCPEDALVRQIVLAGYEPAKARLRQEILRGTLADHGKLLVGVSWRVDGMQASDRGAKLRGQFATLTLTYREGAEKERITIQALPDMLEELKRACEKALG